MGTGFPPSRSPLRRAKEGRTRSCARQKTLLTLAAMPTLSVINVCARHKGGKICLGYTILWEKTAASPDIAVNELIQAASQRFGRVSFQTRSKAYPRACTPSHCDTGSPRQGRVSRAQPPVWTRNGHFFFAAAKPNSACPRRRRHGGARAHQYRQDPSRHPAHAGANYFYHQQE